MMLRNKIQVKEAFGYAFIHFSMEVLCFFFLYRVFKGSAWWWSIALLYDTIAFAGQVPVGAFCEKHPRFRPGIWGAVLLTAGAAIGLIAAGGAGFADRTAAGAATGIGGSTAAGYSAAAFIAAITGFVLLGIGNALLHISGALVTLKVSGGNLSEPGIFVGGGAFGVITGRLLGSEGDPVWLPFVLMAVSFVMIILIDRDMDSDRYRDKALCAHNVAAERPVEVIILILAGVVMVRSYISNGIPMQWKKTVFETVMLYVAMGAGKMAGGVLADLFGARKVGVISCVAAIPFLLLGDTVMWVSLIGILLFSMTMAIALGGIVSVLKNNPGVSFGITTLALFLGTLPMFFVPMPKGLIMNILLALLSLLSAAGIYYTVTDQ